jgi:NAD(P)-dependent dehydrogenase (short-subunit alcohol dehydrogenase family)
VKELAGKVAVVTGAASGIGRALAAEFGRAEMSVVLADVEPGPLAETARELEARGVRTLAVETDVSRADSVSALAERTRDAWGAVHVLCNNAGVFAAGPSWQAPLSDWEWVLGVNVWGVVHGIRAFVPLLLEQGEGGHVVNTASMAGLTSGPLAGAYYASKHAVVSLSETLYHEMQTRDPSVGVSVLCPELIATGIGRSERNRPEHLARKDGDAEAPEIALVEGVLREAAPTGLAPEKIAARVIAAVRADRFYVLPPEDDPWMETCRRRLEDVRLGRNPSLAIPDLDAPRSRTSGPPRG